MFQQLMGCSILGINGVLITVEIDIVNGLPSFDIVGLANTLVRESRERVRAAIRNSGFIFPNKRITVNLAPADIKKDSAGIDLPIAMGILGASGQVRLPNVQEAMFIGELSLEGNLRGIHGILPMVMKSRECEIKSIYVAQANCAEALLAGSTTVYGPENLNELVNHLNGTVIMDASSKQEQNSYACSYKNDFSDVQGQFAAKRALEIAAAGGHNIIMVGPPGAGKTMLARRLPSILPEMDVEEAIVVSKIYSVAGLLLNSKSKLMVGRPFRDPHHSISTAGLIGGGSIPRPGEVTLSHNGVLFLDEFPEFSRSIIDSLRQPMEDGKVTITRANATVNFPAKFMLVAAMNPCPCGYYGSSIRECSCTSHEVRQYRKKISGPILDRIDIFINLQQVEYIDLTSSVPAEASVVIRERVRCARQIQCQRLAGYGIYCNAQMNHTQIAKLCKLEDSARQLLEAAFKKLLLSARGYDRIIKVAQTIADLTAETTICSNHIAEAIQMHSREEL